MQDRNGFFKESQISHSKLFKCTIDFSWQQNSNHSRYQVLSKCIKFNCSSRKAKTGLCCDVSYYVSPVIAGWSEPFSDSLPVLHHKSPSHRAQSWDKEWIKSTNQPITEKVGIDERTHRGLLQMRSEAPGCTESFVSAEGSRNIL